MVRAVRNNSSPVSSTAAAAQSSIPSSSAQAMRKEPVPTTAKAYQHLESASQWQNIRVIGCRPRIRQQNHIPSRSRMISYHYILYFRIFPHRCQFVYITSSIHSSFFL